jgi:hypothetical protein
LFSLLGIGGILLFLFEAWVFVFDVYAPAYELFVGLVGLIGGVALLLGANVLKARRGRIVLLFVTLGLIVFIGLGFNPAPADFTSGASLQVVMQNCSSSAGTCTLQVTNTGGGSASITGANVYGRSATATDVPVNVPAGTSTANPITVTITGLSLTAGASVTGELVVASGSPLAFSVIAS